MLGQVGDLAAVDALGHVLRDRHRPQRLAGDRVKLDALYVYQLAPWIGPYVRFRAETNLLPGEQAFIQPTNVVLIKGDGSARDLGSVTTVPLWIRLRAALLIDMLMGA